MASVGIQSRGILLLPASPKPQTLFLLPLVKLAIFAMMLVLTIPIYHHGGIESGID